MRFQPVYSLLCFPSLVALFFFAANSALAISPEPGLYYDAAQSGKGFYIDVQQGTGLIIFYAGNPGTGKPEYYLATGLFGPNPLPLDEASYAGVNPAEGFNGEIVRLTASVPCLTCPGYGYDPAAHAEIVGYVQINFKYLDTATMVASWKDGSSLTYALQREVFGFPAAVGLDHVGHGVDLRGEWIFVDETDPSRAPWRFQFTEVTPTIELFQGSPVPAFDYVDDQRQATFHCNVSFGCTLMQNGQTLFSARYEDLGLRKIQAFLGPLPNLGTTGLYRTGQVILGMRVEPSTVPGQ
jgi:hypothetical protein